jgi:hypothetical protein
MSSGRCSAETLAPEYQQAVSYAILTATCHLALQSFDPATGCLRPVYGFGLSLIADTRNCPGGGHENFPLRP